MRCLVETIGKSLKKRRKWSGVVNSILAKACLVSQKSQTLSDHLNRKVYIYDLISHILGGQNAPGFN